MNYLAPLQVVVDRLRDQLPTTIPVRTAIDLAQVRDQSVGQPEAWVLFHRDLVKDTAGDITQVEFQVAVIFLTPGVLPDLERDGQVLTAITKALAGFKPRASSACDRLRRVGSLVPQTWADQSLVAYGMLFGTTVTL